MRLGAAPSPSYSNDYSSSKTDLTEGKVNAGRERGAQKVAIFWNTAPCGLYVN